MPGAGARPKAGRIRGPASQTAVSCPIPAASGEKCAGECRGGVEYAGQFLGPQGREIGVERRHGRLRAAGAHRVAPCASAALRPAAGESGTMRAPSAPAPRRQPIVRDNCHIPHGCTGQRRAHGVLGEGQREVRRAARSPAASASLLLARTRGFSGTTRVHATGVICGCIALILTRCRSAPYVPGCGCRADAGGPCARHSGGCGVRLAPRALGRTHARCAAQVHAAVQGPAPASWEEAGAVAPPGPTWLFEEQ